MENIRNLVEYYEELFPVTQEIFDFFLKLGNEFSQPAKFLNIGCGTGILENRLAKEKTDVTGLETIPELIESATRKRRNQLMSVRYFKMSTIEMVRFLGKNFYNVISCLNDRIIFIYDVILLKKFFYDCKQLLCPNGKIVLQLNNYQNLITDSKFDLPILESMRVKLVSNIQKKEDKFYLTKNLETSNDKKLSVYKDTPVYPITKDEIISFAKEAGFASFEFYNDFAFTPFTENSPSFVCVIS